jgi:UDP-N-acetylmuramate dehydrogenase
MNGSFPSPGSGKPESALPPAGGGNDTSPRWGEVGLAAGEPGEGLPRLAGSIEANAAFADFIWFRTGGAAEWLVRPRDIADLSQFLAALDPAVPVFPVGVGSNLIVRDGGLPGVTVRLPKAFAAVTIEGDNIRAAAAAMGITVASAARDASLAGLEFLRGIPGTAGGAVRMNAGAYGHNRR